ncbi:hypothetical protein [Promicromonospora soli]|uniref:Uncharacterized protein n=1 Tax=Promicromonospora soli TaxID=2035533 RepID=A0A919KZW3_9MICO|nr:hypothetical protein [Promicromonospora soli]GHH78777.1 hypothetical protein GCM10017772_42890 [Promicromonospora soli]
MFTSKRAFTAVLTAITALFALLIFSSPASAAVFPANAPSGTHLQTGTIDCTESAAGVSCTTYELAGVGRTNATVALAATYSATIQCTNRGGSLVESHDDSVTEVTSASLTSSKNGRLTVPALTSTTPTNAEILAQADCPNPNWTPSVQPGSVTLESWTYTLTFAGFTSPYVLITG